MLYLKNNNNQNILKMAEKKTVLAKHKTNKDIEAREFQLIEWQKGGSWKKDWELVDENKETAKASKPQAPTEGAGEPKATAETTGEEPQAFDVEKAEALKAEYKELHPEGKRVPNQKVKDLVWIEDEIAKFKGEALAKKEAGDEEE